MGMPRGCSSIWLNRDPSAAAQTSNPVPQALVSMTQAFIDTLVVVSFTGLAIIVTGVWTSGETEAVLTRMESSSAEGGPHGKFF
jgi:AGCS family alanine or glycine:cation symporter